MTGVRNAVAAILLAGSVAAAGTAYAAEAKPAPTAMEQAELAKLSPPVRSEVEARLGQGETVHGVLETMLLNKVSADFATRKIVATDFERGEVVAEGTNGQIKAFPFDVVTLQLRK